jgi:hypothetical protein
MLPIVRRQGRRAPEVDQPANTSGCCGSAPSAGATAGLTSEPACCGTAEDAAAAGSCCAPAAKTEAVASGASCCG